MALSYLAQQAQSAAPSIAVSLAPVVMGGVFAYFRMFVGSHDELRKRISLFRQTHIEKTAVQLAALLKQAANVADGVLRGDGKKEPDLIGDYESDAFRRVTIFHRLERIRFIVKVGFHFLFMTIFLGILSALSATIFEESRPVVTIAGATLAVLQLLAVALVFFCVAAIDSLEETT